MGNVLKFPNSLWQANYTIQQRGGRLPSTSPALQKHQQARFQSIEFGLAGHQDIERNNWIFQTMFVQKTWAKSKMRIFVRHQWVMLISPLVGSAGAPQASPPASAWSGGAPQTRMGSVQCVIAQIVGHSLPQPTHAQSFHELTGN